MKKTKARATQHIMEEDSIKIIKESLPKEWVMRDYKPDYGIDFSVEVFDKLPHQGHDDENFYSLGEMFFIQAKSTRKTKTITISVPDLYNVEKENRLASKDKKKIDVLGCKIETTELSTIHAMGSGLPVLLFMIDLSSSRIFYLCLNDYIDKVLLPQNPFFYKQKTCTIHVPLKNEITSDEHSLCPIRFYAKRAKYYALFIKLVYQRNELRYGMSSDLVLHFIDVILRDSVWNSTENLYLIRHYHAKLIDMKEKLITIKRLNNRLKNEIYSLWKGLASIGNAHEEHFRQFYLPSYFSTENSQYCSSSE